MCVCHIHVTSTAFRSSMTHILLLLDQSNHMPTMQHTTLILQLMGDGCAQKRFFDVILNGCIPVVAIFHDDGGGESSLLKEGCKVSRTYPFSKPYNSVSGRSVNTTTSDGFGLDLLDIVITYNGTCGMACMKEPMERLMNNQTALRQHQLRLHEYAILSSFGLEEESYQYPDSFMATVVSLRRQLWHQRNSNMMQ